MHSSNWIVLSGFKPLKQFHSRKCVYFESASVFFSLRAVFYVKHAKNVSKDPKAAFAAQSEKRGPVQAPVNPPSLYVSNGQVCCAYDMAMTPVQRFAAQGGREIY